MTADVERPFEAEWRARFERFARAHDDEALISGWSAAGLRRRVQLFGALLPALGVPEGGAALDLGCGGGTYVRLLAGLGHRAVGLDYSLPSLARALGADPGGKARYLAAEAYALPFGGGAFDLVLCIGVLQALAEPARAIGEMARVLRPGGVLVVEALNGRGPGRPGQGGGQARSPAPPAGQELRAGRRAGLARRAGAPGRGRARALPAPAPAAPAGRRAGRRTGGAGGGPTALGGRPRRPLVPVCGPQGPGASEAARVKVLHVLDHSLPVMSGYSTRSRNIVVFQKAAGLSPVVLTSPKHGPAPAPREVLEGIAHYRTAPDGSALTRVPYVAELALMARTARRIAAVARAESARVIHAHSPVLNGLPALWAGRRLGVPVVYEARAFWEDAAVDHGTTREGSARYRITRALETFLFRRAARVVTIARAMRGELIERGVDAGRISVVPNGVDVEWFAPRPPRPELRDRLGLHGGSVLGFIGSFYHYEGLSFLLEGMAALRQRFPRARLLLVGGGGEDRALRAQAATLGDGVVFAGQVPYARVRDFYPLVDVFVCPRRRMRLTELVTPLKPLEAMAMGQPILASDVGGHAELIQHDVTGILFPAESRERFVAEAERLLGDAELRARLGAQARAAVVERRTWPQVVDRYLAVYDAVA